MERPSNLSAGQRAYPVLRATQPSTNISRLQAGGRGFEPLRLHQRIDRSGAFRAPGLFLFGGACITSVRPACGREAAGVPSSSMGDCRQWGLLAHTSTSVRVQIAGAENSAHVISAGQTPIIGITP